MGYRLLLKLALIKMSESSAESLERSQFLQIGIMQQSIFTAVV